MNYEKIIELRKIVATRIEEEVLKDDFILNVSSLVTIHERLFKNILPNYGHFRKDNLEKPEYILNEESVHYSDYSIIPVLLRMIIQEEKQIDYQKLSDLEKVKNIAVFTSKIWQIHPFIEGNTRTTCVFIEKYLMSLGYNINNDIFKEHAEYFRNALVRANYENKDLLVEKDIKPLLNFFIKALLDKEVTLDENNLLIPELFNKDIKTKKRILNK